MYSILKQFMPGTGIWVLQLNPNDPIYTFDTFEEAEAKCQELQTQEPTRQFKVSTKE